jgi:hypothetical protein
MSDSDVNKLPLSSIEKMITPPDSGIKEKKNEVDPDAFRKAMQRKKTDADQHSKNKHELEESQAKKQGQEELSKDKTSDKKDPSPYSIQKSDSPFEKRTPRPKTPPVSPPANSPTSKTVINPDHINTNDDFSLSIDHLPESESSPTRPLVKSDVTILEGSKPPSPPEKETAQPEKKPLLSTHPEVEQEQDLKTFQKAPSPPPSPLEEKAPLASKEPEQKTSPEIAPKNPAQKEPIKTASPIETPRAPKSQESQKEPIKDSTPIERPKEPTPKEVQKEPVKDSTPIEKPKSPELQEMQKEPIKDATPIEKPKSPELQETQKEPAKDSPPIEKSKKEKAPAPKTNTTPIDTPKEPALKKEQKEPIKDSTPIEKPKLETAKEPKTNTTPIEKPKEPTPQEVQKAPEKSTTLIEKPKGPIQEEPKEPVKEVSKTEKKEIKAPPSSVAPNKTEKPTEAIQAEPSKTEKNTTSAKEIKEAPPSEEEKAQEPETDTIQDNPSLEKEAATSLPIQPNIKETKKASSREGTSETEEISETKSPMDLPVSETKEQQEDKQEEDDGLKDGPINFFSFTPGTESVFNTSSPCFVTLPSQVLELFERMVGVITVMEMMTDVKETTIQLNQPEFSSSVFFGSQITIVEFSHAPKIYNIRFEGSEEAVRLFEAHKKELEKSFTENDSDFSVHLIETSLRPPEKVGEEKQGKNR